MATQKQIEVERVSMTENILSVVEQCGRTCYKSESKGNPGEFIKRIIKSGHESVLEHGSVTYRIVCDRATSHQIVRHRIASYSQMSQRYCRMDREKFGNQIAYIKPIDLPEHLSLVLHSSVGVAESSYFNLLEQGVKPETARAVLPNCTVTELMMTANLRSWRHFLNTRLDKHAQADIRKVAELIFIDMFNDTDLRIFVSDIDSDE